MSASKASMIIPVIVLLVVVGGSMAYPSGAPMRACAEVNAIHHSRDNHSVPAEPLPAESNPFSFSVPAQYIPGESIEVTISSENSTVFRGFMLQARLTGSDAPIGSFTQLPALTKTLACENDADSVTHTSTDDKLSLTFQWTAPDNASGNLHFRGSVALGHYDFYVDMTSAILAEGCDDDGGAGIVLPTMWSTLILFVSAMVLSSAAT